MNKASGSDGIAAELFRILKHGAVIVLHSICQQIWKIALVTGLEKISFHSNAKEYSNYHKTALTSHANNVILKVLQVRLQQYMKQELPDEQAMLRKGRGTTDQIAKIHQIIENAREFQKNTLLPH